MQRATDGLGDRPIGRSVPRHHDRRVRLTGQFSDGVDLRGTGDRRVTDGRRRRITQAPRDSQRSCGSRGVKKGLDQTQHGNPHIIRELRHFVPERGICVY